MTFRSRVRRSYNRGTTPSDCATPTAHEIHLGFASPGAAQQLPTELLQIIYQLLGPFDFHNARSTCSSWWYAGFDPWILRIQVKRGGWLSTYENERRNQVPIATALSRIIARESSLIAREFAVLDKEDHSCFFQIVVNHCVDFTKSKSLGKDEADSGSSIPRHQPSSDGLPEPQTYAVPRERQT